MKGKILIADDEQRIRMVLSDFLLLEGYEVLEAKDGKEALDILALETDVKMVIVDIMMPKLNGYEVCQAVRKKSRVPIIVLTAMNAEQDELNGFGVGADEYITKPFSTGVLVARVNALFKRTYGDPETECIQKGCMKIFIKEQRVEVNEKKITLSKTEMNLLTYFVRNENIVLIREKILDDIWGFDYIGTDRTMDTHINRLRTKLFEAGGYIKTIHGVGYKFEIKGDSDEIHED